VCGLRSVVHTEVPGGRFLGFTHIESRQFHRVPLYIGDVMYSRIYQFNSVDTLKIGYPAYKLQVKTTTPASRLRTASRLPRVPAARAPTPSSGQLRGRHVSPRLGLPFLARGSSGDATCPRGSGSPSRLGAALGPPRVSGLCRLQSSKQISSVNPAIMITIEAGAPVSSKALRDKGCSAGSQGM
jgi:hypothetical protein